jgi:FolB domain-containing protein
MSKIKIVDLEVFYCVGVSDQERAKPQRLLLTVDMSFDFSIAATSDRIARTIDYHAVCKELLAFGKSRSWKLIEKVAVNLADSIYYEYKPDAVTVEVKKFAIPEAAYVSVVWTKK